MNTIHAIIRVQRDPGSIHTIVPLPLDPGTLTCVWFELLAPMGEGKQTNYYLGSGDHKYVVLRRWMRYQCATN